MVKKKSSASAGDVGDTGSIPGLGRSPGEGNGNPHQYSCLENSMDRGTWQDTVHGVAGLDMTYRQAGLHNKRAQTGNLTEIHILTILEAKKSKTKIPAWFSF